MATQLRPVYAGIFPRFSANDLDARLSRMDPHLATQLLPENIQALGTLHGWKWFESYLSKPPAAKLELLIEVLKNAGISPRVTSAFGSVPRHLFCPPGYQDSAYLNVSIPLGTGSALSSPGIVALMLDATLGCPMGAIVEVGSGSGFHIALLSELHPTHSLHGYERIKSVAETSSDVLRHLGFGQIQIHAAPAPNLLVSTEAVALITQTAVAHDSTRISAEWEIVEGGIEVTARPLRSLEFLVDSTTKLAKTSYNEYLARQTSSVCALSTSRYDGGEWVEREVLYGVRFVPALDGSTPTPLKQSSAKLDGLFMMYGAVKYELE